jgi:uncharacterized protein
MKKKIILFILLLTIFIINPCHINASTNTFGRTEDNLGVPDKIDYKDSMYNNVILTPLVDASEKVYDFADILTESEEEAIYNEVTDFINTTNLDLAIVTINYNTKRSTMEYADDFYDYNDFQIDGLVFVIDMDNREFYISTAGIAILYYDNNRVENILSSQDYYMINGMYKDSIDILITNLLSYYNNGYSNSSNKYTIDNGVLVYKTPYLVLLLISLIVAGIITFILAKRNKQVKLSNESSMYLAKNGKKITNTETKFIDSHTSSHYRPISDNSGGGSSSSGSHSGSSGMSHGGGGHKF